MLSFLSVSLVFSALTFSVASAQGTGVNVNANIKIKTDTGINVDRKESDERGNATSSYEKTKLRGNATSTEAKDRNDDKDTDDNSKGKLMSELHRSTVASFVQKLLDVADREGGIGAQVRLIAQAQNNSASTSAEAIKKVEKRNKLKTLFFGSDYKNLGALRSEITKTNNNIEQLKNLLDKTTDIADRAELSAQIKVLEALQLKTDAFVKANESSFSLFGWFNKAISE